MPTVSDPDDRPQSRLEAEVLEILERTDRPPSNVIKFQAKMRQTTPTLRDRLRSLDLFRDPLMLLALSLVLAILASVVEDGSTLLARLLAVASLAAFIAVYVLGFRRPTSGPGSRRWRGRDMNLPPPTRWR